MFTGKCIYDDDEIEIEGKFKFNVSELGNVSWTCKFDNGLVSFC